MRWPVVVILLVSACIFGSSWDDASATAVHHHAFPTLYPLGGVVFEGIYVSLRSLVGEDGHFPYIQVSYPEPRVIIREIDNPSSRKTSSFLTTRPVAIGIDFLSAQLECFSFESAVMPGWFLYRSSIENEGEGFLTLKKITATSPNVDKNAASFCILQSKLPNAHRRDVILRGWDNDLVVFVEGSAAAFGDFTKQLWSNKPHQINAINAHFRLDDGLFNGSCPDGPDNTCNCLNQNYNGLTCDPILCDSKDFTGPECNNRGICNSANHKCSCSDSFFGPTCEKQPCPTENDFICANRGSCNVFTGICTCEKGSWGPASAWKECPMSSDGVVCSGNGTCTKNGQCQCSSAYTGFVCERRVALKFEGGKLEEINNFTSVWIMDGMTDDFIQ